MLGTDGHWPVFATVPGVGIVIRCECGQAPKKRSARMSTQHCWHQSHRRALRLQPVEYMWTSDDDTAVLAGESRGSRGPLMQVRGHVWRDGEWVRAVGANA